MIRRSLSTKNCLLMAAQPLPHSHPHLLQPGELISGTQATLFQQRRQDLAKQLPSNGTAVIVGYGLRYASGAVFYPFHQSTDFLYLTGVDEQDCAATIEANGKFTLYVRPSDRKSEVWDGPRSGLEGAISHFGADVAHPLTDFPSHLVKILKSRGVSTDLTFDNDVLNGLEDTNITFHASHSATSKSELSISRIIRDAVSRKQSNYYDTVPLSSIVQNQRLIKSVSEIAVMQRAGNIAAESFIELMKYSHAGVSEHMLQATFEYSCKKRGASSLAYVPVIAGGSRALTIHYVTNNKIVDDGDLVLVDAGAEYGGYVSDITRTWPVNGRFSIPQRQIYEAVLKANKECIMKCTQSAQKTLNQIHDDSVIILRTELQRIWRRKVPFSEMNILYPHHIAHYLGMDVHDTPTISRSIPLRAGMVVTIEPGLYIPKDEAKYGEYQGIGVRIEDDIVVGQDSNCVLSLAAPKNVDEIEELMKANHSR